VCEERFEMLVQISWWLNRVRIAEVSKTAKEIIASFPVVLVFWSIVPFSTHALDELGVLECHNVEKIRNREIEDREEKQIGGFEAWCVDTSDVLSNGACDEEEVDLAAEEWEERGEEEEEVGED
jgi:hypothetical protein